MQTLIVTFVAVASQTFCESTLTFSNIVLLRTLEGFHIGDAYIKIGNTKVLNANIDIDAGLPRKARIIAPDSLLALVDTSAIC